MADKLSKQELKAPDAFQKLGGEARDWLQQRQQLITIAVGVVLLGGAGIAIASYASGRGEEKASKELGQTLKILGRPVVENLQLQPVGDAETPFKSAKEKDEALQKALTDFRAGHKGTQAATTAALPLAEAEFRLGNYAAAATAFQDYAQGTAESAPLRAAALEGLGYAHEAQGQLDQAMAAFDRLAKENKTEFLTGMGLFHRGRVLELQSKKEDAAKTFTDVSAQFPTSAAARMASERLIVLASQGVKLPPPPPAAVQDAG